MAINDKNNILVGAANMWVDGVNVGWTQGGVAVRKANEYLDVEGDQVAGTIVKARTKEAMFVTTTLLEAVLANMVVAMSEADSQTGGTGTDLAMGSAEPTAREHTIRLEGKAPGAEGTTRVWVFHRAVLAEDMEHIAGARDAVGVLPLAFELMKDPDNNYNFGYFFTV